MNIWQAIKEMWAFLMSPSDFSSIKDAIELLKKIWYIWGANQWTHFTYGGQIAISTWFLLPNEILTPDERVLLSVLAGWLVSVWKEVSDYRKEPTPDNFTDCLTDNLCWLLGTGSFIALVTGIPSWHFGALAAILLATFTGSLDRINQSNKAS